MLGDGNGWSAGPDGTRCWGRFGAAGLVVLIPDGDSGRVLLQYRAEWTSYPLTWGVPGGARDSHETPEAAAMREANEETGLDEQQLEILDSIVTTGPHPADPERPELAGDWTYHTVFAFAPQQLDTTPNAESLDLRWVPLEEVHTYNLLPAFADSWPRVKNFAEQLLAARRGS